MTVLTWDEKEKREGAGYLMSIVAISTGRHKAGYTAQDAPSTRSFHLRKYHGTYGPTDGRTDTTSYRDATAHLKKKKLMPTMNVRTTISTNNDDDDNTDDDYHRCHQS